MGRTSRLMLFLSKYRVHLFPSLIIILYIIFIAGRISGTSIGIYNDFFYGSGHHDNNLIFGKPQAIRSDEWLVGTQLTIAQGVNNFGQYNDNYTSHKDMSVPVDVPYYDWSTVFRPQNITFFVLPFEYAFAFKWWFLLILLLISSYYFNLKLTRGKILASIFGAVIIGFAPFVFWWYLSSTIGPLAYAFLILLIIMSLVDKSPLTIFKKRLSFRTATIVKIITLAYVLTNFALILYPPFQIPVALVIGAFSLGYLLNKKRGLGKKDLILTVVPIAVAAFLAIVTCGLFVATRAETIHEIGNTVYPGKRDVAAGGYDMQRLLVSYLQPQLQRGTKGSHYIQNQSESSNFILLPVFFIIPLIGLVVYTTIKRRRIDWILVCLTSCILLFLCHLFVPASSGLTRIFLLHYVPQSRLMIGLGFVTLITIIYSMKSSLAYTFTARSRFIVLAYCVIYLGVAVWAGVQTSLQYPAFISNEWLIIMLAVIQVTAFTLLLFRRYRLGLGIVAIFSIGSVVTINPLYIGLGPLYHGNLFNTIQSLSKPNDVFAAANNLYLENVSQMSDRRSITGVSAYPSIDFWEATAGTNRASIYNRYAHIISSSDTSEPLLLVGPDLIVMSDNCDNKINRSVNYFISSVPIDEPCVTLTRTIKYPAVTLYIYQLSHP